MFSNKTSSWKHVYQHAETRFALTRNGKQRVHPTICAQIPIVYTYDPLA
jgi:hypothetical protein